MRNPNQESLSCRTRGLWKHARLAWLGLVLGLAGGLVLAVFLPNTPLRAVGHGSQ